MALSALFAFLSRKFVRVCFNKIKWLFMLITLLSETNTERQDDEEFGMVRTRWQRLIDHKFDDYYAQSSTSSSGSFNINNEPINPV